MPSIYAGQRLTITVGGVSAFKTTGPARTVSVRLPKPKVKPRA